MIEHETQTSHLRFFKEPKTEPFQPYDAICTLVWETQTIVWIKALHGSLNLMLIQELTQWFIDNGVVTVKAHRAMNKTIPFLRYGVRNGEYVELAVDTVVAVLKKRLEKQI